MKKLLLSGTLLLGLSPAFAQDYPGAFNVDVKEMYVTNAPIVVHTEYLPGQPEAGVNDYRWELQPVDQDGNTGDAIYLEDFTGDPSGDFTLPEAVQAGMTEETYYKLSLTGTDANGLLLSSGSYLLYYTSLTLEGETEICCGTEISAYTSVAFDQAYFAGASYQYTLTWCDANGNSLFPYPSYDSGMQPGYPGVLSFPGSDQFTCDTYWRIDLNMFGSPFDGRYRRTKIVHLTSFKIKAKSSYCCGQSLTASAENCPGSTYNVTHHKWSFAPCQADGSNPGTEVNITNGIFWGASGATEIMSASQLTCGQYYRLICMFFDNSTTLSTRYTVIYIAPTPQPVITGPTNICGTGTYCVNNLAAGTSYVWQATVGVVYQSGGPNSNCFTPATGNFNNIYLSVKSSYGCQGVGYFGPITNDYIDPDFYIWGPIYSLDAGHFKIAFQRSSSAGSTSDVFKVEEVNATAPYATVSGTAWTNPCWGSTNYQSWYTPVYCWNYNGDGNGSYNNAVFSVCPPCSNPDGYFRKDRTYKITRTINNGGCISTKEIVFNQYGQVSSTTYREGHPSIEEAAAPADLFTVFPNPNNGSFQVRLSAPAENAQAELMNMLGEKVDAFQFSGNSYSYSPATAIAPGIYMLRITNNGSVSSQRIIIQ